MYEMREMTYAFGQGCHIRSMLFVLFYATCCLMTTDTLKDPKTSQYVILENLFLNKKISKKNVLDKFG